MPPELEQEKDAKQFFELLDGDIDNNRSAPIVKQGEEKTQEEIDAEAKAEADRIEAEKQKKEDGPIFKRDEKKKPTKEESIATLRKQRDDALEVGKVFTEVFGEHKPSAIKPLLDFVLEEADGPITEEYVIGKIQEFKELKTVSSKYIEQLEEKERKIAELDVRESKEFEENFKKPYKEAHDSLFLEFATIGPDKKVIAPEATKAFQKFLTELKDPSGIEVKSALMEFAKEFKKESGEDPTLPSVTHLMDSLRTFNKVRHDMHNAYVNWKTTKEEAKKKKESETQILTEAQQRANKKKRVDLASKAFREFDLEDISFVTEKEAEELFKEEYQFSEKIYTGEDVPEYDSLLQRGVKSRLWDKYKDKLVSLLKLEEEIEEGERNGLPGSMELKKKKAPVKDWLED